MLEKYREQIDLLDKQLLKILKKRYEITDKIGLYKKQNNMPIFQIQRYNDLLKEKFKIGKKYGLDEEFIKDIFDIIHKYSVKRQEKL